MIKKLVNYFGNKNEKIMPYHQVASEVRSLMNVQEGLNIQLRGQKLPNPTPDTA